MPVLLMLGLLRLIRTLRSRARAEVRVRAGRDDDGAGPDEDAVDLGRTGPGLGGRMARTLFIVVSLAATAWLIGLLVARRLTHGDESSDEFRLAVIMGGKEFRSHATRLRSGTAITSLGGMTLDLRDATLDPAGASLELRTTLGGIEVRVPSSWIVEVEQETLGGELKVEVPAPDELAEEAPRLHIHAVTRLGGGLVSAKRG